MNYQTSHHAKVRMQQRGIPPHVVNNIINYGTTRKVEGGAVASYMNKSSLRQVKEVLSREEQLELDRHKTVYVIIESDRVITVGHRKERYYK